MDETFLTADEIAKLLKLNRQTVYNWIDSGSLPAIRVGPRRVRVRRSALDHFLASGKTGAAGVDQDERTTATVSASDEDPWRKVGDALRGSPDLSDEARLQLADVLRMVAAVANAVADATVPRSTRVRD